MRNFHHYITVLLHNTSNRSHSTGVSQSHGNTRLPQPPLTNYTYRLFDGAFGAYFHSLPLSVRSWCSSAAATAAARLSNRLYPIYNKTLISETVQPICASVLRPPPPTTTTKTPTSLGVTSIYSSKLLSRRRSHYLPYTLLPPTRELHRLRPAPSRQKASGTVFFSRLKNNAIGVLVKISAK